MCHWFDPDTRYHFKPLDGSSVRGFFLLGLGRSSRYLTDLFGRDVALVDAISRKALFFYRYVWEPDVDGIE